METKAPAGASPVVVSHLWKEGKADRSFSVTIPAGATEQRYVIDIPQGATVADAAIIFEVKQTGQ